MEIFSTDTTIFHKEIKELLYILEHEKTMEKIAALSSMEAMLLLGTQLDETILNFDKKVFGNRALMEKYQQYMNANYKKFINNFYENKEFHQAYLCEILKIIGEDLQELGEEYRTYNTTYLKEDECIDIITSYLKSIKKENLFYEMIEEKRIFELKRNLDGYNGETVTIINNGDSFIFLKGFDKTIFSLTTLSHELGHIDDFKTIYQKYGIKDSHNLNLLSIYNETISKKYEKDFLYYLVDNNIYKEEAIDILINLYWNDYDVILSTYILSYLPKRLLERDKYQHLTAEEITKYLPEGQKEIGEYVDSLNSTLQDDINYAYGAIISEYLDSNNKDTLYSGYRHKLFNPNFIVENKLLPEDFSKIYQKKLNKLKI